MKRFTAPLALLLLLLAISEAPADPDYLMWCIAHQRMLAKWRYSEPRCGWTVGGNTCSSRVGDARPRAAYSAVRGQGSYRLGLGAARPKQPRIQPMPANAPNGAKPSARKYGGPD